MEIAQVLALLITVSWLFNKGESYAEPLAAVVISFVMLLKAVRKKHDEDRARADLIKSLQNSIAALNVERAAFEDREKLKDKRLRNLSNQVHHLEKERLVDLITGIPNQEKLKLDIAKFVSQADGPPEPLQLGLIDIENFGAINVTYGFDKGDDLITLIATSIHDTTRRTDEIYKRAPRGADSSNPMRGRAYRTYKGGDEFIFILRGTQYEAIGFLSRLAEQLSDLDAEVANILNAPFAIQFHGAVVQLYRTETYKQATTKIYQAYSLAKRGKNGLRLYWNMEEEALDTQRPDPKQRELAARLYAAARVKFAVSGSSA